jgi:hypothetical protein
MLSRFFGKSDKSNDSPTKDAQIKRGVGATEDRRGPAWQEWSGMRPAQGAERQRRPESVVVSPPSVNVSANPAAGAPSQATQVDFDLSTEPMVLEPLTLSQRKSNALEVVELHHHRIANTIRTLWGYKECSVYINKLIMAGGDGMGHARVGFNQDAVQAMLELSDLHDAEFGPPDSIHGGLGLSI